PVEIHYTLDGTEPTRRSPRYRQPIRLTKSATVKCAARPVGGGDAYRSETVTARFQAARLGPGAGVFLSDLQEEEYTGYAPLGVMKDHAYGNLPIRLGGQTYAKGILIHPAENPTGNTARLTYALEGSLAKATRFTALIGIEEQAPRDRPGMGSCVFAVEVRRNGQWERLFESPLRKAGDEPLVVDLAIAGADRLRLVATDGGDGIDWDHAVWADAKLWKPCPRTPAPGLVLTLLPRMV
ncbi:MAG: NPCBM/NEW2 domain-containing protein, partial [Armatimonadota bacterium]|nr:NPCBM/NEW2 domain-containing protein [Armatimonadota bacterium]